MHRAYIYIYVQGGINTNSTGQPEPKEYLFRDPDN